MTPAAIAVVRGALTVPHIQADVPAVETIDAVTPPSIIATGAKPSANAITAMPFAAVLASSFESGVVTFGGGECVREDQD